MLQASFLDCLVFDEFEAWERGMVDVDVGMGGKLTFSMNFVDQLTGQLTFRLIHAVEF